MLKRLVLIAGLFSLSVANATEPYIAANYTPSALCPYVQAFPGGSASAEQWQRVFGSYTCQPLIDASLSISEVKVIVDAALSEPYTPPVQPQ